MRNMNPQAKLLWKSIRNKHCTDCSLHEGAQTVCLIGDGPVPCDLMIVGEAPGFREDDVRKPFAGKAGQLLDASLQEVGLNRDQFFVSNACKCRPPENRTPTVTEIKACAQYLEGEIEAVQPKFILTVGNVGLRAVTKKSGIMKHRGEIYERDSAKVLPTVHPAAVLRNPHYADVWRADLATFARLVRGEPGAIPPRTFLVLNKKTLKALCQLILSADAVAYDLETSGFMEWTNDAQIATIAVAPRPGVAFVVPIHHPEAPWEDPQRILETVGNALVYTSARRIAHNAKFDDKWLQQFGVPINAHFDTMVAAHIIDENRFKGLKPLAQILLGTDPWKDLDLSHGGAMTHSLNRLAIYNAKDADYTLRLYYMFRKELEKPENSRSLRLFKKLMMPASKALTSIERTGLYVDADRLNRRRIEAQTELDKVGRKLTKLYGQEANWNSTRVIADLLFNKLKLPLIEQTAKGAPSTKESVLLRLQKQHKGAALILEWRKWAKYQSTYLERWAEVRDEVGRIHPNYKLTGTVTGRLSSGKEDGSRGPGLNVQQVPRDQFIRSIIGAPEGWRLVEADFSQVELRIAAHYSGDPTLQRLYQLGEDVHLARAMRMTGKPAELVTKEERKKAKAVNFGFLFGMGPDKFVTYARDNYDVEVSIEEAREVRDDFFRTYSSLQRWHNRQRRLARNYKRVASLIGRTRHLPDIDSGDEKVRGEAERQAINSPVQSLASDLMLMSLVSLNKIMDPTEALIVGSIHDAILFELREDKIDDWVKRIRDTMENLPLRRKFGVSLDVPIVVDIKVGQHWGEGEEV